MLTLEQWEIERARLVAAQADIQSIIDALNASFSEGVVWDRTGVVNNPTYSNGDLTVAATGVHALRSTVSPVLGKRCAAIEVTNKGNAGYLAMGAIQSTQAISSPPASLAAVPAGMWLWRSDSYKANAGASSMVGPTWNTGDIITACWDEQGRMWFARNGAWIQGDPVAGTNPTFTGLTGHIGACLVFMGANGSPVATGRFSSITPPTGFQLLSAE